MKIKYLIAAAIFGITSANAAVTPNSAVTAQTPNRGIVQFLQGTDVAGTYKTLYTAGANGSKCNALWETNNDASATHLITVQIVNGGIKYGFAAATTASNDGFVNAKPPLNIMSTTITGNLPLDSDGNPYFLMVSGDTLQATFATALTATDVINLEALCADF